MIHIYPPKSKKLEFFSRGSVHCILLRTCKKSWLHKVSSANCLCSMVCGEEVFLALAESGLRGLHCSITTETCFVCPRNCLVTYWLAQRENVSYLAFAIIREYELLVEILSSLSLDDFSPKSAADLSLFAYVRCRTSCCIAPMFVWVKSE